VGEVAGEEALLEEEQEAEASAVEVEEAAVTSDEEAVAEVPEEVGEVRPEAVEAIEVVEEAVEEVRSQVSGAGRESLLNPTGIPASSLLAAVKKISWSPRT
jgi:hypothetical protein